MTDPTSTTHPESTLDWALQHIDRGWRVFPVRPDKTPVFSFVESATTDPETARSWWGPGRRYAGRMIGGCTGEGRYVLDIDVKDGAVGWETLDGLIEVAGPLPETLEHQTGSGGVHYVFACNEAIPNIKGTGDWLNVDARGHHGFVILPGSHSETGGTWTIKADRPEAELPVAWLELIHQRTTPKTTDFGPAGDLSAEDALEEVLILAEPLRTAATRTKHNMLIDAAIKAGSWIHGFDDFADGFSDQAGCILLDAIEVAAASQPDVPYERSEAIQDIRDGFAIGVKNPKTRPRPGGFFMGNVRDLFPDAVVLPTVVINGRDLAELADEIVDHLVTNALPTPELLRHGDEVVELYQDSLKPVRPIVLADAMARKIAFVKRTMTGKTSPVFPPKEVISLLAEKRHGAFPPVQALTGVPYFRPDGTYVDTAGYDPVAQVLYAPLFQPLPVPASPTVSEIQTAVDFLLEELLADFPFVEQSDRATALAMTILPMVKLMIDATTPIHVFSAPTERTGKTLLVKASLRATVRSDLSMLAPIPDETEFAKTLMAELRTAPPVLCIDNVATRLDSPTLAAALTSWPTYRSRILGVSENASIPVRTIWAITGRNPELSPELAERSLLCRLDAQLEHPSQRTGFRHADLLEWVTEHRAEIVQACAVLVQAWVVAGRPAGHQVLGGFEQWARTMGGIFDVAQVKGLLDVRMASRGDPESDAWGELLATWAARALDGQFSSLGKVLSASELWRQVGRLVDELPINNRAGTEKGELASFGRALRQQLDRVYGGYRIVSVKTGNRATYRIESVL